MGFIRQIKFEVRNILKSRFLLVMAILTIVMSVAVPVIGKLSQRAVNNNGGSIKPTTVYYASDMMEKEAYSAAMRSPGIIYGDKGQPITIDGFTIDTTSPFYWYIQSLMMEKEMFEKEKNPFSTPAALDLMLKLMDEEIRYYLVFARHITTYQDYRMELAMRGVESVYEKFYYEHNDVDLKILKDVASYKKFIDPETIESKYVNIKSEEKLAGIDKAEETLSLLQSIVVNNDFPKYIDMRIEQSKDEIESLNENIEIQNKAILENPTQEETINRIIEDLKRQITIIETNTIPILQYRLAKNIIPGLDIWQNNALNDIENNRNQLAYTTISTEEEWNKNQGYRSQGQTQTYPQYVAAMKKRIETLNKAIIIAQKSLDADKPDMIYVPSGARNRTVEFLQYTAVVALFGILLGGWLIASEYQQGTIRLLMIRPKTRTKILLSKFVAAVVVWLVVDLAGSLLNLITNGALFGFADFAFPNYSVAGEVNFLVYYIPKVLACVLPILFAFSVAFMLSVVVKNIAVAIAIPILFYISSVIIMNIFVYQSSMNWIIYTPIPFMQMASFFSRYSIITSLNERGVNLNLTYGILLLLGLSAVFTATAALVFKKRDIVN